MIYYSHVNEDNRVENALLNGGRFSTVVAICGSGERVLSLMDNKDCNKIVVVDCNEEAIFLQQLKVAALKKLSVDEYLGFIGHGIIPGEERVNLFRSLNKNLPYKASDYWQQNLQLIKKGILNIGHYEKFLARTRPIVKLWLGKGFEAVFKPGGYDRRFPALRWKLLQQMFSYQLVYRLLGNRDTAFTGSGTNLQKIPAALDNVIRNRKASSNFMMHLIFKGNLLEMNHDELPPSLQKKVLAVVKDRLLNDQIEITYHVADFLDFVQNDDETKGPVFYSLSDILSFADFDYLHAIIKATAVNQNVVVGRSFLRNAVTPEQLSVLGRYATISVHDDEESTAMYQVFSAKHICSDEN